MKSEQYFFASGLLQNIINETDKEGRNILFEIDDQLGNKPMHHDGLEMDVPKFIFNIADNIFKQIIENPIDIISAICEEVKKVENKIKFKTVDRISNTIRSASYKILHKMTESQFDDIHKDTPSENDYMSNENNLNHSPPSYIINNNVNSEVSKLFNEIATKTDEKGNLMVKKFYRRPCHTVENDDALSFSMIRRNIIKKKYSNANQLARDLHILFSKALEESHPRSNKYKAAKSLHSILDDSLNKSNGKSKSRRKKSVLAPLKNSVNESLSSPSTTKSVNSQRTSRIKTFMDNVYQLKRKNSPGFIHETLDSIPYVKDCLKYKKEVSTHIDLRSVLKNVKNDSYATIRELTEDLALLVANIRYIYPNDSQIYSDSNELSKITTKELHFHFAKMIKAHLSKMPRSHANKSEKKSKTKKVGEIDQIEEIDEKDIPVESDSDKSEATEYDKILNSLNISINSITNKPDNLLKIKKVLKHLKTNFKEYETPVKLFDGVIDVLLSYAETVKSEIDFYHTCLIVAAEFADEFYTIYPEIPISFQVDSVIIIQSVFDKLAMLKDEYGIHCLTTISRICVHESFPINHDSFIRSYDMNAIREAVIQGQYKRIVYFMNDFVTLLRTARIRSPPFSEPYIHSELLFKYLMAIALSIKPNKYKCDLMINWEEFYYKFPGFIPLGETAENLIAIPEISQQAINEELNYTDEYFVYSPELFFSNVQYKKDLYAFGDFVRVGIHGNISSSSQKIVMIRKFYILPSGKKAFIGHVLCTGDELELAYDRNFNINELVLLKDLCCFRVKDIISKVDIFQANRSHEITEKSYFFFYCLYDNRYKLLFHIPKESPESLTDYSLNKIRSTRSKPFICQPKIFYPENFRNNMLLHLYSRLDLFKDYSEYTNNHEYFIYQKVMIRKNDFVLVQNGNIGVIYQIKIIKPQIFSYNVLKENLCITCQKYVHHEYLKISDIKTFYANEYIQTDILQDISSNSILSIVSVLSEIDYMSFRYTQFTEDKVFVCRWKVKEDMLFPVDDLNQNYALFNDIMFIKSFHSFKFFNKEFSVNLEKIKNTGYCNEENFPNDSFQYQGNIIEKKEYLESCWNCYYDKCNSSFKSYISLMKHFLIYHWRIISDKFYTFSLHPNDIPQQTMNCNWVGCSYTENISSIQSQEHLLRHVKETHLKNCFKIVYKAKGNDITTNVKEDLKNCKPLVLMRDSFVECLLNIIDKRLSKTVDDEESVLFNKTNSFNSMPKINGHLKRTHFSYPKDPRILTPKINIEICEDQKTSKSLNFTRM